MCLIIVFSYFIKDLFIISKRSIALFTHQLWRFSTAWYGSVRLGTVRLGAERFGSLRFSTAWYDSTRYGTVRLALARLLFHCS